MSDKQLAETLFPASTAKPEYKMPDYEYVAREMQSENAVSAANERYSFTRDDSYYGGVK